MIGKKLAHYTITGKLGEGGMGVVYEALDGHLGRSVALKLLPHDALANPARKQRFVQEAKAASALNHPHIVTIYDIDCADGVNYIAMELIRGRTLEQALSRGKLRLAEALKYGVEIADALAAAHAAGIVHRDLKPGNIMITERGDVKVLDFGLAKLTDPGDASEADETRTQLAVTDEGTVVGSAPYMSPEQAEGRKVDARSDIFSFGSVLYEMLTGKRAFRGANRSATMAAILKEEPEPASKLVPDLPREVERVVARCLRKDLDRRSQSMAEIRVALQDLKEESDSGGITSTAPLQRPRKRAWLWAVAAALVVMAALGVWLVKRSATPVQPQKIVPVTTYAGSQSDPCFSPDGNQVAFSWDGEKGDNYDIYVKLLGETNALRLTTDPAADRNPAWSPDGKRIAFQRAGPHGGIYTTSPLGGAEQKLTDFPADGPMSWSPDGKWLAVSSRASGSSGISLLPVEGGEPRRISNRKAPAFNTAPAISRDGRLLAYAACAARIGACDIYVQDLDSAYAPRGSPRRITNQGIPAVAGLAWSRDDESLIFNTLGSYLMTYLWRLGTHDQRPPQRIELAGPRAASPSIAFTGNRLLFSRSLEDLDIWSYQIGGGMKPLIVSSLRDTNPQFSPDGTKIAFASDRSGEANEIWVARADGSGVVQMTNRLGSHQGTPRWSPDGRWIAFDSLGQDGHWDIYVIDASGGRSRRITFEPSEENLPNWSRDGKWIYFTSDRTGRQEIWRVPFAGGAQERITANGGSNAFESADGKTLFYTKAAGSPLFAQPLPGGPERQVLPWVFQRTFVPVEDGIYYFGRKGDDGKYPLQFFQFSSNASRLLTKIEGLVGPGVSVSPDRQTILFSKSVSNGANLMMIENFQ